MVFELFFNCVTVQPKNMEQDGTTCSNNEKGLTIHVGALHDPITWYKFQINYAGTQVTHQDFQYKSTHTSLARLSFVLKVPLCDL